MTCWDENDGHSAEGHLPEGRLLLYLDGELPPKEAALVQEHLTACWSCRMNADRVQEAVFAFVKYRDEALRSLAAPPSDEKRFGRRLEDLRERLGNRSWLAHLYDSGRRIFPAARLAALPRPLVWAMACLVASFVAVALHTWSDRVPVVTASELLQKASEAQARELRATAQPVVYQKLRIRRGARGATWELWRDTTNSRFRQSAGKATEGPVRQSDDPTLASELMEVLRANRMNPQQPLSVAAFQTWRQSLAAKREEVSRSQTEAGETLTLRVSAATAIAVGQITEASLVVGGRDWRPQAQSLKVRGENEIREYELSETAYEVIPLAALTVFTEPAPAPTATRIPAAPPPATETPPLANPLPTRAELQNAEVAALYALHQLKADLGEQIEIARESNERIVVRGQVETPERKRELISALKGIPFVAARIQTFDEATAPAAPAQLPATIAPPPEANGDSAPANVNLFERRLVRYFAERAAAPEDAAAINRRIAQLANSAFAESSAALANGWALRRLAERFDDSPDEQISGAAAARLREVIGNHLAEINTRSRNLRTLLEPALVSIARTQSGAAPSPQPAEGTRKARVMQLFKAVEQVQRLSYRLFNSGQTIAASPEEAARRMLQALAQLDDARLALEQDGHK
ncbi:MAG TPA: zf-HC2 domain-containing protein [Blastocatellia bacterium]|nr:zf-HC2 domain-containing protein [Blastocatellia bacterium]